MERIAIAGVNLQGTDVSGLERIRRPTPEGENAYRRRLADHLGASELVFLATCNRVEVIYAREEGEAPVEADLRDLAAFLVDGAPGDDEAIDGLSDLLQLRTGRDAVQHLFRVASSLDSLMLGEDQIIAQVREAYGRSADIGLVGTLLGPLFHHALSVGKKVRSETDLARHPVSVVNLAVQTLVDLPDAEGRSLAIVGAGEMGGLLARALIEVDLRPALIVNRSLDSARKLAQQAGAEATTLEAFRAGEHPVDVLVTVTSSQDVVLPESNLVELAAVSPAGCGLLGIDLSVPRNLPAVEPAAEPDAPGSVRVVDLDALRAVADRNRALRAAAAADAELLVADKVETFTRRFHEEAAAPVVHELKQAAEEILRKELTGLLGGRLAHLDEKDRRAIERWARSTFGRLMHPSVSAVKRMAFEGVDGRDR